MSLEEQEVWQSYENDGIEALREIEDSLLQLEGDPASTPNIHRLYRGLHSLKGNSGFLGLSTVERLAHVSEDLIGLVRDGGIPLDQEVVDLMLEAVDSLRSAVEAASRDRRDSDISTVADLVDRILEAHTARGGAVKVSDGVAWEIYGDFEVGAAEEAATNTILDDEARDIESFLTLAQHDLPQLSAAIVASLTADAGGAEARGRLPAQCDALLQPAARLGLVHVVDKITALRVAAESMVSVAAAQSLELCLHSAMVDVEAYLKVIRPEAPDLGITALFRRACADMAFGDLARLRDLAEAPATMSHDEMHYIHRRLRFACEYYGFARGAETCLDLEDHFARAIEAGEIPGERLVASARRFVEAFGKRIYALNAGEDVGDQEFIESPTDPMKFPPEVASLVISASLRQQLRRTSMSTLSQIQAQGWAAVEVRAVLPPGSTIEERFRAWLTMSGVVCMTSAVEEAEGSAPTYRLLLGVPSEEALRAALAGLDPTGLSLSVGLIEPVRPTAAAPSDIVSPARAAAAPSREARPARAEAAEESESGPRDTAARADFLRVDARKVSLIMDLASEIGLACGAVTHHPDIEGMELEGFAAAAHKLELLVREMQNEVSSVRLVQVSGVFQRMKRVVRDTARRTGKQVDLVLEGEDTEIDKLMVDSLQDPLVHVLRNAIDHGIETEEERVKKGKASVGRIVLSASHQGGEVSIQVTDDGAGLDRTRILSRARERNLVPEDAAFTDDQINNFIFLPGFSTKETVDELSGRGVGMDVVKTTIEGLRGRVMLRSTPGRGSRITMTMPLTLAFVEAMVVRERDRLFAIPIEKVFEVFKAEQKQLSRNSADGQTLIRVRETLVPVLWLHRFWADSGVFSEKLEDRVIVVVQTSQGGLAIPVDALLGNQQVMLKPLRGPLAGIRAAAGCGMLRSGDVAVALDCEQLHG
jgi:two-component system chemotaxis sensor kinase CheA